MRSTGNTPSGMFAPQRLRRVRVIRFENRVADWPASAVDFEAFEDNRNTTLQSTSPPPHHHRRPHTLSTPPRPPQCPRHAPLRPSRARARPLLPLSSPAPPSDPRPPPPHSPPPQETVPVALARLLQTSALRGLCASTRRRTASLTMPETTSS